MPLGNPCGIDEFEYTTEGLPDSIQICTIPVRDVSRSISFYRDVLHMEVLEEDDGCAYLVRGSCRIILKRSDITGIDTGLFFGTSNPYDTRRRLMDEGVVFIQPPTRGPFGTYTSIRDDDGNTISFIESYPDMKK